MDLSCLSDCMLGPLVGLGTAAAVYLGWLLFHRLMPTPLRMAHGLWILLSVGLGLLGWWMTPVEARYEADQVDSWKTRQEVLADRAEWYALGEVWRDLSAISAEVGPYQAEPPGVAHRLDALEVRLVYALKNLEPLVARDLLSMEEARALAWLAVERLDYLRREAGPPRPHNESGTLREDHQARLESRYRFLGRIEPRPESDLLLWQQRVRLARELAMQEQIRRNFVGGSVSESDEALAGLAARGGPSFSEVTDLQKTVALLVANLSVPSAAPAPAAALPDLGSGCGASASGCSTEQRKACNEAGMPSAGSSCGGARPAAGGCCP